MNSSAEESEHANDINITDTSQEIAVQICDLQPNYESKHEMVMVANVDDICSKSGSSREAKSSETGKHDLPVQYKGSDFDAEHRGVQQNDGVCSERLPVQEDGKAVNELINESKVVDISPDKDHNIFCKTDTLEIIQIVDLEASECAEDTTTLSVEDVNDCKLDEDFEKFMQENSDEDGSTTEIHADTFNVRCDIPSAGGTNCDNVTEIEQIGENYFDRLPAELIIKIFSYLTTEDLCRHVSPVCRAWREMSLDHSLWQCIDLGHHPNISSLDFLWVIRRAPLLRKLSCSGRAALSLAEVDIFTKFCPGLQDIDFGFCDSLNTHMIESLVENCPSLCRINVEGCEKLRHECVERFARCEQLTHINLSHCFLGEKSVIFLAEHLPRIISINLDGISGITVSGLESLVLHHGNMLTELVLDGAEIGDDAFSLLAKCVSLKQFAMSFCECLSDQALLHIMELPCLESLKLRKGMDLSADAFSRFFQKAPLTNLRTLNLSECSNVSDEVVLEMAKVCGKNLKQLELSWCWFVTDNGLVSIVDHCCNLEILDLLGIDKITGECLLRVPEEMPKLVFLDLRQCNQIRDDLIYDVVRRKADLKVFNYYGEEFVHS